MTFKRKKSLALMLKPWHWFEKSFLTKHDKKSKEKKPDLVRDELLGLVCLSLSLLVTVALLSFSSRDLGQEIEGGGVDNWLGPVGASLAWRLLGFFGIFSAIFPVLGFILAFWVFFKERVVLKTNRFFGALLICLSLMPLLAHMVKSPIKSTFLISGELGEEIRRGIVLNFSVFGLFLLALTAIFCGLSLVLDRPYVVATMNRLSAWLKTLKWRVAEEKKIEGVSILTPVVTEAEKPQASLSPTILPPKMMEPEAAIAIKAAVEPDIQIVERDRGLSLSALKKADTEGGRKEYSFVLPPLNLLDYDAPDAHTLDPAKLKKEADKLQRAFLQYGIEGKIREIRPGPVVTNYEFVPAPGIKLSRIAALSDDIAMAMSAVQVRIVTPIPGKGAVGIEVPNEKRETVYLKEIVADERYRSMPHKLCMAIGKDVEGNPYFMNLADMPHVLIAGTTGSGKSVSVNAMICSILYRATPNDVRFLMIDPKMLELSIYSGIPHLLLPPIIDAKKAANALRWAVKEMDQRYGLMKEVAVRDIATYNEKIKVMDKTSLKEVEGRKHEHLPYIVIVVDEYADLLAVAGKEVEGYIMRLAQKARAAGLHVMLATQRPSVDVITGVIKANFPVRMGFRLASVHDSKTIVNKNGAEKLLGRGDALIMPPGTSDLFRVHGAFISEKELSRVVEFLSAQKDPDYRDEIADYEDTSVLNSGDPVSDGSDFDEKLSEAMAIVREHNRCSTSFLQRHLSVGYNRAARIVEYMEKQGLVGPVLNARGEREIFINEKG